MEAFHSQFKHESVLYDDDDDDDDDKDKQYKIITQKITSIA